MHDWCLACLHAVAVCYKRSCSRAETRLGGGGEHGFLFLLPFCFQALGSPLPPLLGPLPLPLPLCSGAIALRIRGNHIDGRYARSTTLM